MRGYVDNQVCTFISGHGLYLVSQQVPGILFFNFDHFVVDFDDGTQLMMMQESMTSREPIKHFFSIDLPSSLGGCGGFKVYIFMSGSQSRSKEDKYGTHAESLVVSEDSDYS